MATPEELKRLAQELQQGQQERPGQQRVGSPNPVATPPQGRSDQPPPELPEPAREFGSQFLRALTDFGSSLGGGFAGPAAPSGQQVAERLPGVATEEPDTFAGRAGRMGGVGATFAVPAGGAAANVPRAVGTGGGLLMRTGRGIQNLVAESGRAFRQRPGRFVAEEGAVGGVAGVGGLAAERTFPDSDAARFTGELLSGASFQLAPSRLLLRGAGKLKRTIQAPRTEIGARRRAARRASEAPTPGERARGLENLETPTTRDPQTGEPVLTPAQRTESPSLLSLERSVVNSSERLQREADEQIAQANQVIQQSARDIGRGGTPEDTAGTIGEGQLYLQTLLNTRLRIAAQRTDERIAELGSGSSREDANRIAREELEKAREAARRQEQQLFSRVDPDTPVPSANAQQAVQRWAGELGKAQQDQIPAKARRLLNPEKREFVGETTNIRELRSLQSDLRETARRARSNEQFTRAEIADDIADSITEDLGGAGQQSEALETAIGFSRNFKQRFRRGAVGRIFGREASGGERVRAGETLERTIRGGGPGEREALDEIRDALTAPEVAGRTGTTDEAFNQAASDFVRRRFIERAAAEGELNTNRAQAFIRDNEQLLSRMPEVRQELEQAVQSGNLQQIATRRRESTRFNDPKVSRATLFIRRGPNEAFSQITQDAPDRAARQTQQLLNRAKRDDTGQAVAGLKSGYVDFLLRPENQRDVAGQPFVSGFSLRELRQNPSVRSTEQRLLSKAERQRLDTIEQDLVRLERARQAKPSQQGVIGDKPSKVLETVAGVSGAAVGRTSAAASGVGGTVQIPGIMANRFRELVEAGVQDPAERLMRDAVRDEQLFTELLQARIPESGELPEKAANRLNAWAAGVVAEQQTRPEQTQETQQAPSIEQLRELAQ